MKRIFNHAMKFVPQTRLVPIDQDYLGMLLDQASALITQDVCPPRRHGCKNCDDIDKMIAFAATEVVDE